MELPNPPMAIRMPKCTLTMRLMRRWMKWTMNRRKLQWRTRMAEHRLLQRSLPCAF
jgi:hypothetical protein